MSTGSRVAPRVSLNAVMHTGFFLLLAASVSRFVAGHGWSDTSPAVLWLTGGLALAYGAGIVAWDEFGRFRWLWLATVIALWIALVVAAPSFSWCAVPLFFVCLRVLRPPAVIVVVVLLGTVTIVAQVLLSRRMGEVVDPSLVLVPVAVALMVTTTFLRLDQESRRRQRLIEDLLRTREELAASQHAAGIGQERERLAREIHDSLAQGLSSLRMLLQAAERSWDGDPERAKAHVHRAVDAAGDNLEEARRFVHDLAPVPLERGTLAESLRELAEGTGRDTGPPVRFSVSGSPYPVGPDVEAALLRIAQGALANVVEHAAATEAAITLTYWDSELVLDVLDNGVGFAAERVPAVPARDDRGFGLTAIRQRVNALSGTMVIESDRDGTALSVRIPHRTATEVTSR